MNTYSIQSYIEHITALLLENKTTGTNHSADMLHYTTLNLKRLDRWLSKGEILAETKSMIAEINAPQKWIVITEAWCGDAAHSIGFIAKMAELNPLISLEFVLRDENLELMDKYLTNGGRSIPKLIVRDEQGIDLFDWGPRPEHIQTVYQELRKVDTPYPEISLSLQKLYNKDKGVSLQKEVVKLLAALKEHV
jgi:hypothetical protein